MSTYTEFKKLVAGFRSAETEWLRAGYVDRMEQVVDVWHEQSLDDLVVSSERMVRISELADELTRMTKRNLLLQQQLDELATAPRFEPQSFDQQFAIEMVKQMDVLLSKQEATVAALARLGSMVDDVAPF